MRNFDLTPLLRTTVGFDRMARALDTLADEPINSFPPYNIEAAGADAYRITMAVAGFGENDIDITAQDATLVVSGGRPRKACTPCFLWANGAAGRALCVWAS